MFSFDKTTKVLRWAGGGALVLSAIHFMMSGRYDMNSLSAHYLFLGLNAFLCVLGVASSSYFKEVKTARTFITLSLAMVPSQMAQLGAFIHSRMSQVRGNIPEMMELSLPDGVNLLLLAGISLVILLPIIYLGFSILFRSQKRVLSLNFMVSSLAILLPFREHHFVGPLLIAILAINFLCLKSLPQQRTFEANVSKALIFIPSAIVMGRNLLYPNSGLFWAYSLGILTFFLFYFTPKFIENIERAKLLQGASVFSLLLTLSCLSSVFSFNFTMSSIIFVVIVQFMSFKSIGIGEKYRKLTSIILPFVLAIVFMDHSNIESTIILILPLITLCGAIASKERSSFILSSGVLTVFTSIKLVTILSFPQIGMWQVFAIGGILLIIISGFLEKRSTILQAKVTRFMSELS